MSEPDKRLTLLSLDKKCNESIKELKEWLEKLDDSMEKSLYHLDSKIGACIANANNVKDPLELLDKKTSRVAQLGFICVLLFIVSLTLSVILKYNISKFTDTYEEKLEATSARLEMQIDNKIDVMAGQIKDTNNFINRLDKLECAIGAASSYACTKQGYSYNIFRRKNEVSERFQYKRRR